MVLAGNSALDVDFHDGVRRIELVRGEALFTVVHDERRPFIVDVGDGTIRDIGTVFLVSRREAVRVVVAEGSVEASSDERRTLLVADQALAIKSGNGLGEVEAVDASQTIAWTRGKLIIKDRSLEEILATLAPHYRGRIVLLNRAAARRKLSVVIDLGQVDRWLSGLAETKAVRLHRWGGVSFLT